MCICLLGGGGGGTDDLLTIYCLRNGLSVTMKSGAKGAEFFFRGPQRCQKALVWGQKWLEKLFTENQAHDDFLEPSSR